MASKRLTGDDIVRAEITEKARAAVEPQQHAPLNDVAELFVELRKLACMSQLQVSAVLGLTRSSVANMERGRQPVTVESLGMLASHLGLEVVVTVREKVSDAEVRP